MNPQPWKRSRGINGRRSRVCQSSSRPCYSPVVAPVSVVPPVPVAGVLLVGAVCVGTGVVGLVLGAGTVLGAGAEPVVVPAGGLGALLEGVGCRGGCPLRRWRPRLMPVPTSGAGGLGAGAGGPPAAIAVWAEGIPRAPAEAPGASYIPVPAGPGLASMPCAAAAAGEPATWLQSAPTNSAARAIVAWRSHASGTSTPRAR